MEIVVEVWHQTHLRRPWARYELWIESAKEMVFWDLWKESLWTPYSVISLLLAFCAPNRRVLFSCAGISCWLSPSASRASGAFGGKALPLSRFLVLESSSSLLDWYMVYNVYSRTRIIVYSVSCPLLLSEIGIPDTRAAARVRPSIRTIDHPLELDLRPYSRVRP